MTGTRTTPPGPRFAPAREDGLKPWVRASYHFGRTSHSIVWAGNASEARYAFGKMHLETVKIRRATPADVEAYS